MKKVLLAVVVLTSFSFASQNGYKMIHSLQDSTNSNNSVEINISDGNRPVGFIIKESKQDTAKKAQSIVVIDNDMDRDGIQNAKDRCPDTPQGKVVDKDGCIKLIRLNVRFAYDKYDITKDYSIEIQKAVNFLFKNSELSISVDGHTDSDGPTAYNQTLSEKRANAVTEKLFELGVGRTKIKSQGFGELKPIVPNDSDENKAINRRVDISFNR